ncbi:rhodanese-like domain-containing protein [Geodermatophilus sp. SYSU D00697]
MISEIDQTASAARLAEGAALVVDVREPDGHRLGHVPGAHDLPLSVPADLLPQLPKRQPVDVTCRTGGRSGRATALVRAAGIDATDVAGGTDAWIPSGRPVHTVA